MGQILAKGRVRQLPRICCLAVPISYLLGDPHCHILPEDEYVDWRTMLAFFDYRLQRHWVNGRQPVV
jgi:hypothetical protein